MGSFQDFSLFSEQRMFHADFYAHGGTPVTPHDGTPVWTHVLTRTNITLSDQLAQVWPAVAAMKLAAIAVKPFSC
jgi:hypothetical protein